MLSYDLLLECTNVLWFDLGEYVTLFNVATHPLRKSHLNVQSVESEHWPISQVAMSFLAILIHGVFMGFNAPIAGSAFGSI